MEDLKGVRGGQSNTKYSGMDSKQELSEVNRDPLPLG
jgi:hypothetical protein